jgi:hypothetical protein
MVYGIIAALSPLPAGAPLVVLGLVMIAAANPAARPLIRRLRRKWKWFDKLVAMAGHHGPKELKIVVKETQPHDEAEPEKAQPDADP